MTINKSTLLLTTLLSLPAQSEILMQWNRVPLPIDLNVNQERIVFVDKNVQVGLPSELDGKLRVQSTGGAVYLKANETFDLNRIQLRDMETGQIVLLDVRSKANTGKLESVRIIFDESVSNNKTGIAQTDISDPDVSMENPVKSQLPPPAALTRYAAQSLYAPLRTVEPLPGVRRIAAKLPKSLPTLMPNLSILATPLDSWGLDGYVVTAVRLKNLAPYQVNLDPRYLQGYFYSATFQHNWLGKKGTPEDTTVVYLVTEGAPNQAFVPNVIVKKASSTSTKTK
ncbi:TIGR03749 family integrating conjugative element protein [Glaesserella australis]|uniref:TIGR03749 family integrating conjugative element protein n=1 Tax=Glaesserella australis TaxID=2094024 RepID=A0A328BUY1_9PAST|nr:MULTISPECIES: TIGR03749 family integrating conjugative element protein [Glaesserella]AUI65871.1 TIGR03749 family integrating conjugative element protein [Glaesserella sp. 15-184]RAL17983.1 TIGR03749 family integrating conjugative element protein [Glaesserella australis]HDX1003757.1 TIGR03749 family integrating conjugative element protein [Pasteurella multocida]